MREASTRRARGRPQVYADAPLVFSGIALHPRQNERLRAYAAARGLTLAAVLRRIVSDWEAANFAA
jgi:hypothetical protein